jgi:hypothetical protein
MILRSVMLLSQSRITLDNVDGVIVITLEDMKKEIAVKLKPKEFNALAELIKSFQPLLYIGGDDENF